MRHVILEGPDGSGKTYLARRFEALGMHYHHEGPPPEGVPPVAHYINLLMSAKTRTVFDRFHLGQLVYGPLLRGEAGMDRRDLELITKVIVHFGTSIVFCYPPWETCLANTRTKQELIKDEHVLNDAWKLWGEVVKHYPTHVQPYDYTADRFLLVNYPDLSRRTHV